MCIIEILSYIMYSFIWSVVDYYSLEDLEFMVEFFDYVFL